MSELKTAYLVIIREDLEPESEIDGFELAADEMAAVRICEQRNDVCCEITGPLPIETLESLQ